MKNSNEDEKSGIDAYVEIIERKLSEGPKRQEKSEEIEHNKICFLGRDNSVPTKN